MNDRLAEIKARAVRQWYGQTLHAQQDCDWLIEQVERMHAVVDAAREVLSHCVYAQRLDEFVEEEWIIGLLRKPLQELDQ